MRQHAQHVRHRVQPVSIHAPAWGATQGSASIRSCRNWFQSTHPRGVRRGQHPARTHPGPVSIHAPAWGATPSWSRAGRCPASFNPRTRVGCDAFRQVGTKSLTGFNPRTRVGCDLGSVMPPFFVPRFNPRTRVGCDPGPYGTHHRIRGFNPRTRVGCDAEIQRVASAPCRVSIHAPAWGATGRDVHVHQGADVSIHAPAWGATRASRAFSTSPSFQSTHPRGVRRNRIPATFWDSPRFQSTHPRGVRRPKPRCGRTTVMCFNPRTRVGCDGSVPSAVCNTSEFQSTHPRGVRPYYSGRMVAIIEFQSTHPRGVRPHAPGGSDPLDLVSIHAPAWGATSGF